MRGDGHSSSRAQMHPGQSLVCLAQLKRPWEAKMRAQDWEEKQLPVEPIVKPRHNNKQEASGSTLDAPLHQWVQRNPAVPGVVDWWPLACQRLRVGYQHPLVCWAQHKPDPGDHRDMNCQDMLFLNFYFNQFYSHFTNDYLLLHRHLLNDSTTLMIYDSLPTSWTRMVWYWDTADYKN